MPGTIRVCHVITLLELGGAQENTLYTVSHLKAPFVPSLVCGPGGILDEDAKRIGIRVRFVPSLARAVRPARDLAAFLALVRIFREGRPDIVHTHSSKAGILGRLAARRARVPKVVHTIHGYGFHATQSWAKRRTFLALERLAARFTDHFIAVSRANLAEGLALGLFTPHRVSLIRSGIALGDFGGAPHDPGRPVIRGGLRHELGLPEDTPIVGMVACLKPQKSPLTFVEVAARVARDVPGAVFVVAGDGELRAAVETRASELGLEGRLRLLGWRRDIPNVMASLDVLLHTSLWEGLPRVLPEAIASGVPIVATRVDGTSDILQDGSTGIVCAPGDIEGLAQGVRRLLLDRDLGRVLAERARAVLGEFDIDEMVRSQERLYLSLLRSGTASAGEHERPQARAINNDGPDGDSRGDSRAPRDRAAATR
jgi:glycosyltransferase involved in cell wall biosynthesis